MADTPRKDSKKRKPLIDSNTCNGNPTPIATAKHHFLTHQETSTRKLSGTRGGFLQQKTPPGGHRAALKTFEHVFHANKQALTGTHAEATHRMGDAFETGTLWPTAMTNANSALADTRAVGGYSRP